MLNDTAEESVFRAEDWAALNKWDSDGFRRNEDVVDAMVCLIVLAAAVVMGTCCDEAPGG